MKLNSVEILCSIERSVVPAFDKYLRSQIKRSSQSYQLWLLLRRVAKARPKVVAPAPGIIDLAQKLDVSSSQVRNRLADLIALYQEYLAILRVRSTPRLSALLALEQAIEMNDESYVSWAEKKVNRLVTERKYYSTYALYDSLRFNRLIYEYHAEKSNRTSEEDTSMLNREFDEFMLVVKCKLYLDAVGTDYEDGLMIAKIHQEIKDLVANRKVNAGRESLSFSENTFYHLYLIVKEGSDSSYQFIFLNIKQLFSRLAPHDLNYILVVLTNRIGRKIMAGGKELHRDYFELVMTVLDFPEIKVSELMLKNFVTMLCRMQNADFAEKVLNTYLLKLPNDRQHQCLCYNMAIIKMVKGELEEATALLGQITLSERSYYVGGRFVLFRAMYKAGDYEGVLSLTKSFKGYIKGLKDMSAHFKNSLFFFLKCFNELVRLSLEKRFTDARVFESRMKRLLEKVTENSTVASRDWLIDEIKAHL